MEVVYLPCASSVRHAHLLGRSTIGHAMEIGMFTAVCDGTIDPAVIKDDIEIDNWVTLHMTTPWKRTQWKSHAQN